MPDPTPSAEAVARELLRDITMQWMRHLEARVEVSFMEEWLDFAAPLFDDALSSARAEGRREMQRVAATTCLAVIAEERFGAAQSARECFHRLRSLKDEDIAGILTEAQGTYEFFNGDCRTLAKEPRG